MAKRSITDIEIALIKAMLARGMTNTDIQFHFNRPDRPVNTGRITGIGTGVYSNSSEISAASDDDLDALLKPKPANVSVPLPPPGPLDASVLAAMFARDDTGTWRFTAGESDEHECKLSFGTKYLANWIKAVAALANNRGGYVLFGVHDKETPAEGKADLSYAVVGLSSKEFAEADPADLSKHLKSALDPTPRIRIATIVIGGKTVGVIHVDQHGSRPVIATKQVGDQIREGDILFRYPGQSNRIKYSDLRGILDQREAQAREQILPLVQRLLELGPNRAMVADLEVGALSDGSRKIMIDKDLVDRIKFIKEGEFDEKDGAPTLCLVGNVEAAVSETVYQRGAVTQEDILRDFLNQTTPYDPKEYIRAAVEGARGNWIPVNYFAAKAGLGRKALATLINGTSASAARKKVFLDRVAGKVTAFQKPIGKPLKLLSEIESGVIPAATDALDAGKVGSAVSGLAARPTVGLQPLLDMLKHCVEAAKQQANGTSTSLIRRAVCRVDELFFG